MSMITVETLCTLLKYALERMKHQGVSDQLRVHTTDSKCVAAISKVIIVFWDIQVCYILQDWFSVIWYLVTFCMLTASGCFCNKYFDFLKKPKFVIQSDPFTKPVDLQAVPYYTDYIFNPMDLTQLEKVGHHNMTVSLCRSNISTSHWLEHNVFFFLN